MRHLSYSRNAAAVALLTVVLLLVNTDACAQFEPILGSPRGTTRTPRGTTPTPRSTTPRTGTSLSTTATSVLRQLVPTTGNHTNDGRRSILELMKLHNYDSLGQQGAARTHSSLPDGKEQYRPTGVGAIQEAVPQTSTCLEACPRGGQWYDKNAGIEKIAVPINFPSKGAFEQTRGNHPFLYGERISDTALYNAAASVAADEVANMLNPEANARIAQATMQAQATNAGNSFGEVARNQAASAIDYCGSYLHNFTVDGGNKWNQLRDTIFVPMGILLLLPGAVLTQVRAVVASGSSVIGSANNPFEGILRSLVAVFMIPATYLVMNFGIDVSNSISHTINSEYESQFGSSMYKDALCAEMRAFPVRQPMENRNAYDQPTARMNRTLMGQNTAFARLEARLYANKIEDPCAGVYVVPRDRADEALPSKAVAARLASNSSNMALTTTWNILCAFQMAYLYYLWCVGPVVAGLWVWPMKQLRDALPSWIEGVITLCFWSLFWNTVILLMACFRGVDETGTVLMSALNFLATACVKFAFDFAGLVRAAGHEAGKAIEKAMNPGKESNGKNTDNKSGNTKEKPGDPGTTPPSKPKTEDEPGKPYASEPPPTPPALPPVVSPPPVAPPVRPPATRTPTRPLKPPVSRPGTPPVVPPQTESRPDIVFVNYSPDVPPPPTENAVVARGPSSKPDDFRESDGPSTPGSESVVSESEMRRNKYFTPPVVISAGPERGSNPVIQF